MYLGFADADWIFFMQELAAITDEHVEYSLRAQDAAQGKWLEEDPSLAIILTRIR
jgi:hypothetical protein